MKAFLGKRAVASAVSLIGLIVLSFYHPLMLGFSALLVAGITIVVWILGRSAVGTAIGESNAKYEVVGWMEELARHPGIFRHPEGRRYAVERADRLEGFRLSLELTRARKAISGCVFVRQKRVDRSFELDESALTVSLVTSTDFARVQEYARFGQRSRAFRTSSVVHAARPHRTSRSTNQSMRTPSA